jgi:Tc toxin complex TcA C-terminal TcB-binding domain
MTMIAAVRVTHCKRTIPGLCGCTRRVWLLQHRAARTIPACLNSISDERYLPFEYLGAVSRWRIELPPENNFFDADTLTDFVLHINYTAREGGEALRRPAQETANCHLPDNGWCLFDVPHDFPDAWEQLRNSRRDSRNSRPEHYLRLRLRRDSFPLVPCSGDLDLTGLVVLFDAEDGEHHEDLRASQCLEVAIRHVDDEDDLHWEELLCVTSGEWPCFYHGVLPTRPRSVKRRDRGLCVRCRIPDCEHELRHFFLACRYQACSRVCGCDRCQRSGDMRFHHEQDILHARMQQESN